MCHGSALSLSKLPALVSWSVHVIPAELFTLPTLPVVRRYFQFGLAAAVARSCPMKPALREMERPALSRLSRTHHKDRVAEKSNLPYIITPSFGIVHTTVDMFGFSVHATQTYIPHCIPNCPRCTAEAPCLTFTFVSTNNTNVSTGGQ